MARLSNFHILCPLIDQSNFLGVVSDSSNDCVIVTLGRNIVIRYKISDRKQVGSWSTREKLTSPVIFDTIGRQYVAVFNHKQIRIWKQEDEDLDAIKKHKLPEPVHTMLVSSGATAEPVILFQSGRAWKLSTFIGAKEKLMEIWEKQERMNSILREDERLEEWHMITCQTFTYIILSARASSRPKNPIFYLMKLVNEEDDEYNLQRRFTLQQKEAIVVAHTFIQQNGTCSLLTLWSNGKIYRLNLDSYAVDDPLVATETVGPGCIVDSVRELFDLENKVAMVALGPHHIALYGADSFQGAVVYIVDIHSSVTGELPWEALKESAAKQCLESCNVKEINPRIWNAAGHLFIPSSDGRLILASYELGSHTPLANLIGCLGKKTTSIKSNGMLGYSDQLLHGSWLSSCRSMVLPSKEEGKCVWHIDIPLKVQPKLRPLIDKGLSESRICGMIFPELMSEADEESISWCLSHFRDIPEENLVNLLCFFLSFTPTKKEKKSLPFISPLAASLEDLSKGMEETIMNGDLSDESEKKDKLEIGHVFVKGRRRSMRVMKCKEPNEKGVVNSQDLGEKGMNGVEHCTLEARKLEGCMEDRQRKAVEKLLSVPVSSFILLPALRSKLPFRLALKLIRHLLWLLSESDEDECPSSEKIVEWICHLLDAFYQQYTLSQDQDVLDTLRAINKVLDFQIQLIEALKEMEPLLLQLKSGRIVKDNTSDKWYSIENIRLY